MEYYQLVVPEFRRTMKSLGLFAGVSSVDLANAGSLEPIPVAGLNFQGIRLSELDQLGRRLNRWREAMYRYARRVEGSSGGTQREFWVNRFLRAATKAGRASTNYYDRLEKGLPPLEGTCFGEWCLPPVRRFER